MYELELFAGVGGGILGHNLLGHVTVGAVEVLPYARRVLLARQRDQCIPMFPIWDDVRSFRADNPDCRNYIAWLRTIAKDLVVSGGFPCQDISSCGKGDGIKGEKSGLWREFARIVGEIHPRFVFAENSPFLATRGLEDVLSALAALGYDARWCVLGAEPLGLAVKRERLWILGVDHLRYGARADHPKGEDHRLEVWGAPEQPDMQDVDRARLVADGLAGRDPDGVANRVDRLKAAGNCQIPAVAALAWRVLTRGLFANEGGDVR